MTRDQIEDCEIPQDFLIEQNFSVWTDTLLLIGAIGRDRTSLHIQAD